MTPPRLRVFSLTIPDAVSLDYFYLPFVINGGLFIPTKQPADLGEMVFVTLRLGGDRHAAVGRVVWLTPEYTVSDRQPGIGIQFDNCTEALHQACRQLLGEAGKSAAGATLKSRPGHDADARKEADDQRKRPGPTL